ncbi:heme-binding protein [Rhodoferax sp. BLA1]|uniref:SOUL family heme-binding protein n=1 Tax=Rhodoferax sp. BLA1 TaxID=2576062 RepID=UPI0021059330|nr:heme-binding protein [Rhodoferax sp. BLA1]
MRQLLCFLAALMFGGAAMAVEEAKFQVLAQEGGFELRQYAPLIVAETWVEGDMDAASSKGFRAIADYIFGNNTAPQTQQSSKIAMTAPVTLEPQGQPTQLAMTAPVTVEPAPDAPGWVAAQRWRVQFVMPSQYTLAALPQPNSAAVTLREVPGKTMAVATYSGFNTNSRIQTETQALLGWIQTRQLVAAGPAQLARYDPPWTLPIWRRNEIQIEIKAAGS